MLSIESTQSSECLESVSDTGLFINSLIMPMSMNPSLWAMQDSCCPKWCWKLVRSCDCPLLLPKRWLNNAGACVLCCKLNLSLWEAPNLGLGFRGSEKVPAHAVCRAEKQCFSLVSLSCLFYWAEIHLLSSSLMGSCWIQACPTLQSLETVRNGMQDCNSSCIKSDWVCLLQYPVSDKNIHLERRMRIRTECNTVPQNTLLISTSLWLFSRSQRCINSPQLIFHPA